MILSLHVTQGAVLASSDKGSLRVEFSKNPLGKKRDRNGNLVDHSKSFPRYQPVDITTLMPEHLPSTGIEGIASATQGISHIPKCNSKHEARSSHENSLISRNHFVFLGGII